MQQRPKSLLEKNILEKDLYSSLGVNNNIQTQDIEDAYKSRTAALKSHRDEDSPTDEELEEAHGVLKDPAKRAEYDRLSRFGQHFQGDEAEADEDVAYLDTQADAGHIKDDFDDEEDFDLSGEGNEARQTYQALLYAAFFRAMVNQYMWIITLHQMLERAPAQPPKETNDVIAPGKTLEETAEQVKALFAAQGKKEPEYNCKIVTQNGGQILLISAPNQDALHEIREDMVSKGLLVAKEKSVELQQAQQRQPEPLRSFGSRF